MPLDDLFFHNQLTSLSFGDFLKSVVNDLIGLGIFLFLDLGLLEKRFIRF